MGRKSKTTEEFIIDAWCVHGDRYNYKLVEYKNAKTKVKIICPDHGAFEQRPGHHLRGQGCFKCKSFKSSISQRHTNHQFIKKAKSVHGGKYDYSLVEYKNNRTKVKIICPIHGVFEQTPNHHLQGKGCKKCGVINRSNKRKKSTEQFIIDAYCVHGDRYNYKLVEYKNRNTKVNIICPIHGVFEQRPYHHLQGKGCKKCHTSYTSNNIPKYDRYKPQLQPYGIECRRNKEDSNVLEVKCMYCGRWYMPKLSSVKNKIQSINGTGGGESNLYCSDECKRACPTYKQHLYPKDFKLNTSREVQPALRKLVLERDNYTCQKCDSTDKELHCHHYEGIEVNPIESADMDICITLCKDCHNEIHKSDKCGIKDYKRGKC